MSRYALKFPRRVRIHGGEFDESARAIHREDGLKTIQAESGIVLDSTIERKQMSTKTTFKRIALVTVAALGFGTMAAVPPASAAATVLTSVKVSDATAYGYVGETLTASVKVTLTGAATGGIYSGDDSITLTAKITSLTDVNLAALTTTGATQSVDSVASESSTGSSQLAVNKFRLMESSTADTNPNGYNVAAGVLRAVVSDTTTVPATVASVHFRPTTPGTYKVTVTPSNVLAGGSVTHTAGVITFVVHAAVALTSDGDVPTGGKTAGAIAGAGNYNQVKVAGQNGASGTTALGTRVVVTGSTFESAGDVTSATIDTAKTVITIPGTVNAATPNTGTVNVLTPTVGTVTVSTFRETAVGTYSTTAADTVVITVRATGLSQVYSYNEAYMSTSTTTPTATTDAAAVLTAPTAAAAIATAGTVTANIVVSQYDVLEVALGATKTKAVTAEITGAGRISMTNDAATASSIAAAAAASANDQRIYIWPDGRSGPGTVVVKVDGVVALTRTVSFTGVASQLKLVAATAAAPNPSKSYLAVGGTMTISVLPYDANSIKMDAVAVTATSETATVATVVAAATAGSVTVTGVAVGKTNITIKNGLLGTLVVPVEVTKSTGVAVLTLDKTSAEPGEKVTWTITATDANSRPVADGTSIALFSSITANMSVTGLPTGSETLTGGVSTGSFFAPVSGSGTLTITATHGTAHNTYIAGLAAATAAGTTYTAVKDVVSMAIANAAVDAATAAAELAEAAAQDATDAALDATEAATLAGALAQEAVDAVAELSTQVATLIAALKDQITKLTNLVVKIQKKVKA